MAFKVTSLVDVQPKVGGRQCRTMAVEGFLLGLETHRIPSTCRLASILRNEVQLRAQEDEETGLVNI